MNTINNTDDDDDDDNATANSKRHDEAILDRDVGVHAA